METMLKGTANKEAIDEITKTPASADLAISFEVLTDKKKEIGKTTAVNRAI